MGSLSANCWIAGSEALGEGLVIDPGGNAVEINQAITDSGLDIDALKIVANGVNRLKNKNNAFVVITHYQRLLNYIVPDVVHVLYGGRIIKSGDKTLALALEEEGYDRLIKEAAEV